MKLKFTTQHTMMIPDEAYKNNLDLVEFEIPEGTRHIGKSAFAGCENLRSIIIPNSVTAIGKGAFFHCRNLKVVVIPAKVKTIGEYTFADCYNLKSVNLPQGLRRIECGAFLKCFELKHIAIPSSVRMIDELAFDRCDQLDQVSMSQIKTINKRSQCLAQAKDYLLNRKERNKYYPVYLVPEQMGEDDPAVLYYAFSDEEVVPMRHFLDMAGLNDYQVDLWNLKKQKGVPQGFEAVLNDPNIDYDNLSPILDLGHHCYLYRMMCVYYTTDREVQQVPFVLPLTDAEYAYLLSELLMNRHFTYNDLLLCNPKLGKKLTKRINNTSLEEESLDHNPFLILFEEAEEDVKEMSI